MQRESHILKIGTTHPFILFQDNDEKEIILVANFKWPGDNIIEINFTLKNLTTKTMYKICEVRKCAKIEGANDEQILIQLSTSTTNTYSTDSISFNDNTKIPFKTGSKFTFSFNASTKDCRSSYICEFDGDTPKTKRGTIIVGA